VDKENIEACHRIKGGKTILKLSRRKDCMKILDNKKKLKDLNCEDVGFTSDTKLYINNSLCSYYKLLWSRSKKLYTNKKIHSFFTSNGTVKIRLGPNSDAISVTHQVVLHELFPDFDFNSH